MLIRRRDGERQVDTICAPYPQRTIRMFRAAVRSSEEPREQAGAVLDVSIPL